MSYGLVNKLLSTFLKISCINSIVSGFHFHLCKLMEKEGEEKGAKREGGEGEGGRGKREKTSTTTAFYRHKV